MTSSVQSEKDTLPPMTQNDLRQLGMEEVGYIKQYNMKGKASWVLHAADGTALAVQENAEAARMSAQYQELDLVSVH